MCLPNIEQMKPFPYTDYHCIYLQVYKDFMAAVVKSVTGDNQSAFQEMYGVTIDHEYQRIYTAKTTPTDLSIRWAHTWG